MDGEAAEDIAGTWSISGFEDKPMAGTECRLGAGVGDWNEGDVLRTAHPTEEEDSLFCPSWSLCI